MSHEIRTPMNGILGFSNLLKEPGLTGEEQQEYIEIIEKSGERMLNIISEIVDISRIESGETVTRFEKTNINEQIENVYKLVKSDAENKGINLSFKNSLPDKEAFTITDQDKLYVILTNLLKNAIKYTDKGSIEFGYEIVETRHVLSLWQFYVKDMGIGIPKNRQEFIFERFNQADIADVQARQGAGLGLSIAKAYVEMLGGRIWVESEVEKGSVFYFTLPYNAKPEEKAVVENVVSETAGENLIKDLKILIAEDDEPSERLISIIVNEFSKEVIKVKTGIEAVETCRNNPDLDLILMDIQMPDLNGHEATLQIRQFNKGVVIIAQTAFGLYGDREKAIESGCNDYISKPINKAELLKLILKYFRK
jgi:CheY-like chemotaxis protein